MPLAKKLAAKETQLFPDATINPDHAVVMGAAIQAALIAEDKALDDVVMTDVSPFSVGIGSSSKGETGVRVEDIFSPIIERNTPLPASRVQRFYTTSNNQKSILVDVYQGEAVYVQDNVYLDKFNISIPKAKSGKESIDVRITYDISGLIEVEATAVSTGMKNSLVVETNVSNLDKSEIQAKLASLAKLKVHPKEDEANIALLNRLNRLYEMTSDTNRDEVRRMLVDFESVLAKQDPKAIEISRDELIEELDMIDEFYVT